MALQIDLDDLTIAQQHIREPTYRIREIRHSEQEVVLVGFDYITEFYGRCKEVGGRYKRRHSGQWWPLSDTVLIEMRKYFRMYQPRNYQFEGQSSGKYSNRSAAQLLRRAVNRACLTKRLTLHTLRHSHVTHLTKQGVHIRFLQEIPGHKPPKHTRLYTDLGGKGIRNRNSSYIVHYMPVLVLMRVECACINELASIITKERQKNEANLNK